MKENYILGLDLGVGSVGWSCMKIDKENQPCKLIAANSYIFPQEKGSMEDRRNARSLRRLVRRKKGRIKKVKRLFVDYHYLDEKDIKDFYTSKAYKYENPYQLKCKGLENELSMDELYICLMHYAKYRGFKSNRKIKEEVKSAASASEEQKLLFSIEQTQKKLDERNLSISQYIINDPKFANKIKNTDGTFHIGITRKMIVDEAIALLDKQLSFGLIDESFKKDYIETLMFQRSFSDGPNEPSPYAHPLQKMIGICGFDHNQRAPLSAPSYELFVLIQKLQNISFCEVGTRKYQSLNKEHISTLIELAMSGKEIKYKNIQKIIGKDVQFKGLVLTRKDYAIIYEENKKYPEKTIELLRTERKLSQSIYQMKSLKYMKTFLKKMDQECDDLKVLDEIADLLSKYKSDSEIQKNINNYELLSKQSDLFKKTINCLDESKFKEFGKLSFEILYSILPLMKELNTTYSQAMNMIGYDHSKKKSNDEYYEMLPSMEKAFEELELSVTNRAVIMTLQETKKIINALISQYGRPHAIHVELARELTKNKKERNLIIDEQLTNKINKMNIKMQILNKYSFVFNDISQIHHDDIVKYRLYMEQGGIDPYTLAVTNDENAAKIKEKDLFSREYEIDHILPYSKSFNDLMSNKVLVSAKMNQEKGNHLPRELFQTCIGFEKYIGWMQCIRDVKKRENLMAEKITDEMQDDFQARSLNDTRYATRVLCDVLHYYFPDIKIRTFTGQFTAKLKGVWGLNGYTHSYQCLDYRMVNENNEELIKLQKALSKLAINSDDNKGKISELKKKILKFEKEIYMKNRDNHLHHALDATVIACATDTLRRRVEMHEQKLRQESQNIKNFRTPKVNDKTGEFYEYETKKIVSMDYDTYYNLTKNNDPKHFPKPYPQFHDEVILRIYERDESILRKKLCTFTNYTSEDLQKVHPLYISYKCDKKENGRLHKATIFGIAPNPKDRAEIVLTNRIRINSEKFDYQMLEKLYDKDGTQKQVYEIIKKWLAGYKNGSDAFKGHGFQYPKHKNGNTIQKVKLDYDTPKEEICIHDDKNQYVEKENVIQIHIYKTDNSDKLYFIGMDRYRIMNFKNNPNIMLWWGQGKNRATMKYSDLHKNGYQLYNKLYKNQIIKISLKNGAKGLCRVIGFSSGMLEIDSIIGDGFDLVHNGIQSKINDRVKITVSKITNIETIQMDILGNIRR